MFSPDAQMTMSDRGRAWILIQSEMNMRSFKKHNISSSTDGTEDDFIYVSYNENS